MEHDYEVTVNVAVRGDDSTRCHLACRYLKHETTRRKTCTLFKLPLTTPPYENPKRCEDCRKFAVPAVPAPPAKKG